MHKLDTRSGLDMYLYAMFPIHGWKNETQFSGWLFLPQQVFFACMQIYVCASFSLIKKKSFWKTKLFGQQDFQVVLWIYVENKSKSKIFFFDSEVSNAVLFPDFVQSANLKCHSRSWNVDLIEDEYFLV